MTLQFIHDNLSYDLLIDNNIKYHGNVDYISSHIADGCTSTVTISDNQIPELKDFVKNYKTAAKSNSSLTIEQFFKMQ